MTKSEELGILKTAIHDLGTDSYLGPWLGEIAGSVEHDIRSDYFPQMTRALAIEQCAALVAEAKTQAAEMVRTAQEKVDKMEYAAEQARNSIYSAIRQAARQLNDY